jgi:hypothetical protein
MFEALPFEKRVLPSIVMIFGSSKGFLLLIVNVILMTIAIAKTWFDRRENAKSQIFASSRSTRVGPIASAFDPD